MDRMNDRHAIAQVIQDWALARDTGDWAKLSGTFHPGATMTATWFQGSFDAFVDAVRASFERGARSMHVLGGTTVDLNGARAIAQTRMSILLRAQLDGEAVDVSCFGRFYDRFEQRAGAWKIVERRLAYEKDRIDPVRPGAVVRLDETLLAQFPEGYRHLAYLQTRRGDKVIADLPGARGAALDRMLAEGRAWLDAAGSA